MKAVCLQVQCLYFGGFMSNEIKIKRYEMKQMFGQAELKRREVLCVQGLPAQCNSMCPIHLDARSLTKAVADGNYTKARTTIKDVAFFDGILSHFCEAPCEAGCRLGEISDPIQVRALEQVSYENGAPKLPKRLPMVSKKKSIGVIGNDLFCLSVACELEKKSYKVSIFYEGELTDALLARYGEESRLIIETDVSYIQAQPNITRTEVHEVTKDFIEETSKEFDCLVIGQRQFELIGDPKKLDQLTLCDADTGYFTSYNNASTIQSLSTAKIVASSIDRLVQNVPIGQNRINESSYVSGLYTSLDGVIPSFKQVDKDAESIDTDDARREAQRCIQCECLECLKGCAYLSAFQKSPRNVIRETYNNLSIVMGNHMANNLINSCALCGQCANICPNGFDVSDFMILARRAMVDTKKMPQSTFEFALLDMKFSMSEEFFMYQNQYGFDTSKYLFFPGCQMGAILPSTLDKTYEDLTKTLDDGVGLLLGCCGIMAYWAGETKLFEETIEHLKAVYESAGSPTIIVACPSCMQTIKSNITDNVIGIWDVLLEKGLVDEEKRTSKAFIHDACGARNHHEIQESIRALAGRYVEEIVSVPFEEDTSPCCGYGGLQNFANRDVADQMSELCISQSGEECLTYCVNCRDRFVKKEKKSRHILELVYGDEPQDSPSLSQRRRNRKRLKKEMLKKYWKVDTEEKMVDFTVTIDEEVQREMEDRMILTEDVYRVIEAIRNGASIIFEKSTETQLANARVGNVTFWIRFTTDSDGNTYHIHSAYSHRMTVSVQA
jgi:Fe-S oxidoreductase